MGSGRGGREKGQDRNKATGGLGKRTHTKGQQGAERGGAVTGPQEQPEEKPTEVSSKDSKGEKPPRVKGQAG